MGLISSIEVRNSNKKDQDLPEGIIVENIHDIGLVENFFTKDECKKFIDLYDKAKQLNLTFNRQEGEKIPSTMKQDETYSPFGDCYVMERLFDPKLLNLFLSRFWKVYERYVSEYGDVMGGYGHQINALRVQETQIGGGYHIWHYESQHRYADRFATFMVYFNDVQEGGETEFLRQHLRFKPQAGNLIIWPAGYTHMHRGNPPISNKKIAMTGWTEWSKSD